MMNIGRGFIMEEKKITYKEIWKIPSCRRLIISNLINRFGDSVDAIAFTWLVYQITQSAAWSALIFGLNQLPGIFVQPLAGPFVEGRNKKRIVIVTDILRGLITAAFVALYYMKMVSPLLMAAFTIIITTVESFNIPASSAFVPELIDEKHYVTATGFNMTASKIFELIGMGAAGVIIASRGVGAAMLIDAATFFIGAAIIAGIEYSGCRLKNEAIASQSYSTRFTEGLRYLVKNKTVLYFCFICVLLNFILTPLNGFLAPVAQEVYGMDSNFMSVCVMLLSGATVIASLVMPRVIEKYSFDVLAIVLGSVLGVTCAALSLGGMVKGNAAGAYMLGGTCFIVLGFASGLLSGCLNVTFVKAVDHDYLARIGSVFNAIAAASTPVATLIVSMLAVSLSVAKIILGFGILGTLLFVGLFFLHNQKSPQGVIENET
jgi:MFS family permease